MFVLGELSALRTNPIAEVVYIMYISRFKFFFDVFTRMFVGVLIGGH